jgi:hypothetical protein
MIIPTDFVLAFIAAMALGIVVPALLKLTRAQSRTHEAGSDTSERVARLLWYLTLALLIASPLLSFVMASSLGLVPRKAYSFVFLSALILASVGIPLLIAKALGSNCADIYGRLITAGSGLRRNTVLALWLSVALGTLAIGLAMVAGAA